VASCLPPAFKLVSCLAYSSTLTIEETSVDFQRTIWRYTQKMEIITKAVRTSNPTRKEFLFFFSENLSARLVRHNSQIIFVLQVCM
jgi:hypothetical protein